MSSTQYYQAKTNKDFFIQAANDEDYEYYKQIEDDEYFRSLDNQKRYRVHGKYVSTFHPGKRPNEYYCFYKEAMTLRSGKMLNYINKYNCFWNDLMEFNRIWDGTKKYRCFSVKNLIWLLENYYHVITTSHSLITFYDTIQAKLKEFIKQIELSSPAIYKKRAFRTIIDNDGEVTYIIDNKSAMPEREKREYTFCSCHYTVVKRGKNAIEQEGHHQDEYIEKLKNLLELYSRPHNCVTMTEAFKIVNAKINNDCSRMIFSYLSAGDIVK